MNTHDWNDWNMDDWEKFNETSLPEKEDFYSHLNVKNVTDVDYEHAKRMCKDLEIKNLGEYHDLYVQSNTLLLANVLMYLRSFEIYVLKYINLILLIFLILHQN